MAGIVTATAVISFVIRVSAFILGTYIVYELGETGIKVIKERKMNKVSK